jgi:MFS family permease
MYASAHSDIMQKTGKHYSPGEASFYLAIPNFTSMFAFPIVGYLVDKYGRSLYWCAFASSMLIVAHVIFLGNANEVCAPVPVYNSRVSLISAKPSPAFANQHT